MTTHRWLKLGALFTGLSLILVGILSTLKKDPSHGSKSLSASSSSLSPSEWLSQLQFSTLDGKTRSLSDLKAKVYFLNFWASWCEACMVEMPSIQALYQTYHSQGLEVLAVNLDDNPSVTLPQAVQELHLTFPTFVDPNAKLADLFHVQALPLSVLFSAQGEVLYSYSGGRNWNDPEMKTQIERWLQQNTQPPGSKPDHP
jgi:thiol-disulfide isomerase/thioredoxin